MVYRIEVDGDGWLTLTYEITRNSQRAWRIEPAVAIDGSVEAPEVEGAYESVKVQAFRNHIPVSESHVYGPVRKKRSYGVGRIVVDGDEPVELRMHFILDGATMDATREVTPRDGVVAIPSLEYDMLEAQAFRGGHPVSDPCRFAPAVYYAS